LWEVVNARDALIPGAILISGKTDIVRIRGHQERYPYIADEAGYTSYWWVIVAYVTILATVIVRDR
jgi:hypothetical protein